MICREFGSLLSFSQENSSSQEDSKTLNKAFSLKEKEGWQRRLHFDQKTDFIFRAPDIKTKDTPRSRQTA